MSHDRNLGLNVCQFLQDLAGEVSVNRINRAIESGLNSGVATTPTLFINGNRYTDRWSMDRLMAAIATSSH